MRLTPTFACACILAVSIPKFYRPADVPGFSLPGAELARSTASLWAAPGACQTEIKGRGTHSPSGKDMFKTGVPPGDVTASPANLREAAAIVPASLCGSTELIPQRWRRLGACGLIQA